MNDSDRKLSEKIEALHAMPGMPLDKEDAWQKLRLRLEAKPTGSTKRTYYYYGMAAALVLIVIC